LAQATQAWGAPSRRGRPGPANGAMRGLLTRTGLLALAAAAFAEGAEGGERGAEGCWVAGFNRGQCCNAIYGPGGNRFCWDDQGHSFETCCNGKLFHAQDCPTFVSYWSFGAMGGSINAMGQCAEAMESDPQRCNSANTTALSCPACASISEHMPTYIRCVRNEQAGPGFPIDADVPGSDPGLVVGGMHYPTLMRPRSRGRDYSLLAPAFDAYVGAQLIGDGHWMPQEVAILTALLPVGGVAVDAGANLGGFTLPFARRVGPRGQVHSFEPFRLIYQALTANCAMNGLQSCHTHNKGLGSRSARKTLRAPGLNALGNPSKMYVADEVASELHIHYDRELEEDVEVVRLDDVPLRGLDLVKIDVESMELDLLQGAERTLAAFRPVIYVEDSEAEDLENLRAPTKVMRLLSERHAYVCINLAQSGLPQMTSLLCAPGERIRAVDLSAIGQA